jgi:predicted ATP-dependent serine protease
LSYDINVYVPGKRRYHPLLDVALAVALLASYTKMPVPAKSLFVGELDLVRGVRIDGTGSLRALADLVIRNRGDIKRVWIAKKNVAEFREMQGTEGEERVRNVAEVRGVGTLDELIRELWPKLFEERGASPIATGDEDPSMN